MRWRTCSSVGVKCVRAPHLLQLLDVERLAGIDGVGHFVPFGVGVGELEQELAEAVLALAHHDVRAPDDELGAVGSLRGLADGVQRRRAHRHLPGTKDVSEMPDGRDGAAHRRPPTHLSDLSVGANVGAVANGGPSDAGARRPKGGGPDAARSAVVERRAQVDLVQA